MISPQATAAYQNRFFRRAGDAVAAEKICTLVRNWFPITQAFCQGLTVYCAQLVEAIRRTDRERRCRLEAALLTPLAILAEEFGLGRHGVDGIHYRMFARLGEPLNMTLDALRNDGANRLAETRILVTGIEAAMQDVFAGAACIRVVEATAYNIVESFDKIFRFREGDDGSFLYSDHQLEYITLHLVLEKEHDSMSADFICTLRETDDDENRISAGIEHMCGLFGNYWEAMACEVFGMPRVKAQA